MAGNQRLPVMLSQALGPSRLSPYVCRSCRRQLLRAPKPNDHQVRHAMTPFTTRLRKKIWGTENPPGLADPYGPSYAERRKAALEEQAELERRKQMTIDERLAAEADDEQRRSSSKLTDIEDDEPFEDDPEVGMEYKPAETWDGLEHIGHRGHYKDMHPQPGDEYNPWLSPKPQTPWPRERLVAFLHQAIVENIVSNQSPGITPRYFQRNTPSSFNITLSDDGAISGVEKKTTQSTSSSGFWPHTALAEERPEELEIKSMPSSVATDAEAESIIEEIARSSPTVETRTDTSLPSAPSNEIFLSAKVDFANPLTFQIIKRFQQLSSIRLSDPFVNDLARSTSQSPPFMQIIDHILDLQTPKAQNLYETLIEKPTLLQQSNLMILPRRETPVDKEKEVGRWKIIERELRERGLPILGRQDAAQ